MNKWSEQFHVEYPECKMCGKCCKCASPSFSYENIKERAKNGDKTSKDFIDIFIPYESVDEARKLYPDIVERTFNAAQKSDSVRAEDLVFFHCKYIGEDNKCKIHENRPDLCRSYPDVPFLVFAEGCAYEPWAKECKRKHGVLMEELQKIKSIQKEFAVLKEKQQDMQIEEFVNEFSSLEQKYCKCIAMLEKNGLNSFEE